MRNVFKFNRLGSMSNPKKKKALIAIGIAEIAIGLMEIAVGIYASRNLVGIGTFFIVLGIIFLSRARQIPTQ